jgi:hypothetical protein
MEPKEPTEPITDVIFRVTKQGGKDYGDAEVTAILPADPADVNGSASMAWVNSKTRPATPAEYASLKQEMESAPYTYRLRVVKRATAKHREALQAELNRWKNAPALTAKESPAEPKGTAGE